MPGGNPVPSLDWSFTATDAYGLPYRTANPTTGDAYAANSFWNGGVGSGLALINEMWVVAPAGANSIKFNTANYGGTSTVGGYIGTDPANAVRKWWNTNNGSLITFDISAYPTLCGQHIVYARTYLADGYNLGGVALYWDIGAGAVVVPNSNIHGVQPH